VNGKSLKKSCRIFIISAIVILTSVASLDLSKIPVLAADGSIIVYTTATGSCYHRGSCHTLKKSKYESSLAEAVGCDLRPCSKCNPPTLDSGSSDTRSYESSMPSDGTEKTVWLPASGKCYHSINNCGQMNPSKARSVSESDAKNRGYKKCSKCWSN
jgi:hypothetical protein